MVDQMPELILIAVDNSWFTRSRASGAYRPQLSAIRLYCQAKLLESKKNSIGLYTIGCKGDFCYHLDPTSDADEIMAFLDRIMYGGDLDLSRQICMSMGFINQPLAAWQVKAHKRLLFLVGGPTDLDLDSAKILGAHLKQRRLAVDVVSFLRDNEDNRPERLALEGFVSAANHEGNSHIKHIQRRSSLEHVAQALSSSPPIISPASMEHALIAANNQLAKEKQAQDLILANRKAWPAPPSCRIKPTNRPSSSSSDYNGFRKGFHKGKMPV